MTPLRGVDGEVYAIAQGSMVVSGFGVHGKDGSRISLNVPCGGRIPNGATVEREVPNDFATHAVRDAEPAHAGLHHLRAPDARASTSCWAMARRSRWSGVSVKVAAPADPNQRIAYLSTLEQIEIEPGDAPARVIVNSRTGTVVIGSHVRVMPAAVAHGSLSVTITERTDVSQPDAFCEGADRRYAAQRRSTSTSRRARMFVFNAGVTSTRSCAR